MPVRGSRTRALLLIVVVLSVYRIGTGIGYPSWLTLEDAIRLAVTRNPLLAAGKNEVQALEGIPSPQATLNPLSACRRRSYPISANPDRFFSNQEITLRFDYEIERGGGGSCAPRLPGRRWRRTAGIPGPGALAAIGG